MARETKHDGFESDIILETGVNTTTADQYIYPIDSPAPVIANNGIFQDGGITELYELKTDYAASSINYVTQAAGILSSTVGVTSDLNTITLDGVNIGQVSCYGVLSRTKISGAADVALTRVGTYITLQVEVTSASTLTATISEYSLANVQLHTRAIAFTSQTSAIAGALSWSLVKYYGMAYSDNQEIISAQDPATYLLKESSTATSIVVYVQNKQRLFCWRFESSNGYFTQGQSGTSSCTYLNSSFASPVPIDAFWAHPIDVNGQSAIYITTTSGTISGYDIHAVGYVGFDKFGAFHSTEQWTSMGFTSAPSAPTQKAGYGTCESIFTLSGLVDHVPSPSYGTHPYTGAFGFMTLGVDGSTYIYYYGDLTNTYLESSLQPFTFRCLMNRQTGLQDTLSVATTLTGYMSELGTLITNVGEFDFNYTPQIVGFDTILYSYGGSFHIVKIGNTQTSTLSIPMFQEIDRTLYKINTISPINIVDTETGIIELGSIDYNGRMPIGGATTDRWVGVAYGKYSNSIDFGEITGGYGNSYLPGVIFSNYILSNANFSYEMIFFKNGVYNTSFNTNGNTFTSPEYSALAIEYIPTEIIPTALGYTYGNRFLTGATESILLDWYYTDRIGATHQSDAYVLPNIVSGVYTPFTLFGNVYLFDGQIIWLAIIQNNLYQSKEQIAVATGLTYLCSGPTEIYFLSEFDNSLYIFTGGRDVQKLSQFNKYDTITQGAFNLRDNTLLLDNGTNFFWKRGNLITMSTHSASQTNINLYSTESGVILGNNTSQWQYSYIKPASGSTVVPLSWQSGYIGAGDLSENPLSDIYGSGGKWDGQDITVAKIMVRVRYETSTASALTLTWNYVTEDNSGQSTATITPTLSASNYAMFQWNPPNSTVSAFSLGVSTADTTQRIILLNVVYWWKPSSEVTVSQSAS